MITPGVVRGVVTLILLSAFLGLVVWLAIAGKRSTYEAAARLPLNDDEQSLGSNP